jgi:serine/threonine protein kinase
MTPGPTLLAGRYLMRERIGAGGMGEVWRATDEVLGRTVAVKLILPALLDDPGFVRRFLAEARAMASVQHPGVVAIHDFHGDADGAYLVMEFVDGEPLSRLLGRVGRLGPAFTLDLVRQAASALQAVHDRGIVHRDVKPANLLLRPNGSLALTDFGIAAGGGSTTLTAPGQILGTPSYLAPEQVLGQAASPRSDVYALGVVAYECLSGRRPFVGENPFAVAMQRVGQAPPPLDPDTPPAVAALVARAMAPDPAQRWPSAAELATAAATVGAIVRAAPVPDAGRTPATALIQGVPTSQEVVNRAASHATAPLRRRRRWAIVAVLATVAVLTGGTVAILANRPGLPPLRSASATTSPPAGSLPSQSPAGPLPAGYVTCGALICPTTPKCWSGLTQIGDIAEPPRSVPCTEPHYWETFATVRLPADARTDHDLSHLMDRSDIEAICSAQTMATHSVHSGQTQLWRRDAWPIPTDAYTTLVHCLGGSPQGESVGSVFTR